MSEPSSERAESELRDTVADTYDDADRDAVADDIAGTLAESVFDTVRNALDRAYTAGYNAGIDDAALGMHPEREVWPVVRGPEGQRDPDRARCVCGARRDSAVHGFKGHPFDAWLPTE